MGIYRSFTLSDRRKNTFAHYKSPPSNFREQEGYNDGNFLNSLKQKTLKGLAPPFCEKISYLHRSLKANVLLRRPVLGKTSSPTTLGNLELSTPPPHTHTHTHNCDSGNKLRIIFIMEELIKWRNSEHQQKTVRSDLDHLRVRASWRDYLTNEIIISDSF